MRESTRQARAKAFLGPARLRPVKITKYTLCDTPGCNHDRGAHPRGEGCRHNRGQGPFSCPCEQFTVRLPEVPKRPAPKVYTDEDLAVWRADLDRGLSYREVHRRHKVSEHTLRSKLPGYNGNSTHPNGTNGIRNRT